MFDVSLTNNYIYGLFIDGGNRIYGPGTFHFKNWGNKTINVSYMGDINFIDLGDQKLNQYTEPKLPWTELTLGGLVRYRNLDAYFRYDNKGQVDVVVDQFGTVQLSFSQGGMIVNLDDLTVTSST